MNQPIHATRRQALKALAYAPLLPLAGSAASMLFSNAAGAATSEITGAKFIPMPAPGLDNPAAMSSMTVGSSMQLKYADGTEQLFKLQYEPFFVTGAQVPDGKGGTILAGGCYDIAGKPLLDASSKEATKPQIFSDCPDGMSLMKLDNPQVEGVKGNALFAVVQFEYTSKNAAGDDTYGQLPSPIAVLTLDQDPKTGKLSLVKYHNIDTTPVNGLWITCGASLSPWNTHLSSEEYEPDATKIEKNEEFIGFSQNLYGDPKKANPYHYGHMPEVTVNADGTGSVKKHYNLGRISHELIQVMPDERTALMGDDATNGGLFIFVADKPRDLSAGTLYVAKWTQKTKENGGSADLSWINLGHATSDEIKALADKLTAKDILDAKSEDPNDPAYVKIAYNGKPSWVKIMPGQEKAAAFLETHRYAAVKGGSMGFTKMEGTTVNVKDKIAYSAMAAVRKQMSDGSGGIAVDKIEAGVVYAHTLGGGQKDDTGAAIDSEWVPVHMAGLIAGEDLKEPDALGNLANADKIGNPDNLKYSEKLRTLFIGEDSGMHVNNFLWAYNVDTKELSRILSTPAGAESTGLHAVDEINGFTYIMSNFQHAADWELKKDDAGNVTGGLHVKLYKELEPLIEKNYADSRGMLGGAVGYLTGLPATA
ncbi:PhoX family protein [Dongia sedimenti]|uniref:DUF839 domain-containing protein n=1 Tax=Dongia sedimenti TaxID=3064282 RepID=A0ABU0YN63_9PROT|nr:DUF839 domain-containing protein [Rhodospirillaceae bacterium R-7]